MAKRERRHFTAEEKVAMIRQRHRPGLIFNLPSQVEVTGQVPVT